MFLFTACTRLGGEQEQADGRMERIMGIFSLHRNNEKEAEEKAFRQKTEEMLTRLEGEMRKEQEILGTLSQDVKQTGADVRRHDMALEDCLDALDEQQEEKRRSQKQIRKLEEDKENLLGLLAVYQEQLWGMKKYAEQKDSAWFRQLGLVEKAAEGGRLSCGIAWIEEAGVKVDYALHDVIDVRAASGPEQDMQVAEVYSPGCIYQGNVKKKAKVAAYRLEKEKTGV